MKITNAEVIVCSPGRNFVTLKVTTESGLHGWGDATLNGRELAVATYLEAHLIPCIIGRDIFDTEDIWQYLYRGVYWRRGAINMTAIGALDMALWDLKGKALGIPVYKLLGGKSRHNVLTYTHAQGDTVSALLKTIENKVNEGFRAIRVQSAVPGLKKTYGISSNDSYEPAEKGQRPVEELWDTKKYLDHIPLVFEQVRQEFDQDIHLLHDAHHRLTPIEAAHLGKSLEPFNLFWLEDATPAEIQDNFKWIRQHTTIPLAVGEIFNTIYDCHELLSKQYIDYLRMTVAHGGGLTPLVKIAALAELHGVKMACHGPSDLSPINLAACLHLGTAINNFGIQEYMGYPVEVSEVFRISHHFEDGAFLPCEEPGLGVDFNEKAAKKYPYQKAFLPVNRLQDGTLYHW